MNQSLLNLLLLKHQAIAAFSQPKGQTKFADFDVHWDNDWKPDFTNDNTEWRAMGISDKMTGDYAYTIMTRRDRGNDKCPWVLNCNFSIEEGSM